ncbi:MAG: homogentisate 1,2-dioxygenase [Pigmentiphaga sp.]
MNPKWNFTSPQHEGAFARQAHTDIPEGSFEREMGRDGFFGAASHLYHRNPPTAWLSIEGPAKPRAFGPFELAHVITSPWDAVSVFSNAHVRVRFARLGRSMNHLVRNADGDELLFIHEGGGDLFCDYGRLCIDAGDYVVIPRGTMWRIETATTMEILMIESTGEPYALPERGLIGRHAPFDPGLLDRPRLDDVFLAQPKGDPWQVRVKRHNAVSTIAYPYNPLDAIGWKGDLYPVRLNIRDIRAITSDSIHLPPSIRTTFVSKRFIVCSLVPRLMETDPGAMKLPFFHNNDDYDEVIFQHRGKQSSRSSDIRPGVATYHPSGVTHGPHPQMLPHMFDFPTAKTEGYSVMIDTRDPLEVDTEATKFEVKGYAESWRDSIAYAPDAQPAVEDTK